MDNILVIGASGQIGTELTLALRQAFGENRVVAADIREASDEVMGTGPFELLDVLDEGRLRALVKKQGAARVYLLAALLSGTSEKNPRMAWDLNMNSLLTVLEMAKEGIFRQVFWPSSIAAFGPTTPKKQTPQLTVMEPSTVYGISKQAGERWCEYYFQRHGVDVRSLRYPGIISYKTEAGGGTTDYAVDIFYEAVKSGSYLCFLKGETRLPMMFMPDALKAAMELMEAESADIRIRSSYNVGSVSFTPEELAAEIRRHLPHFKISYEPDFRQAIADSWPHTLDDAEARKDWGWEPAYDLPSMTAIMLREIKKKHSLIA